MIHSDRRGNRSNRNNSASLPKSLRPISETSKKFVLKKKKINVRII
jgi:hypothetical protein